MIGRNSYNRGNMKMKAKNVKKLSIALGVVGVFFAALFVFLMVWFFGASYPAFDKIAEETFTIQGLKEGISPQGLCALPAGYEYDFAMSGYMVKGEPSRIYLINSETNESKYITLTRDGKEVTSHFGGVTATDNFLIVADGKYITRVSLDEALFAENGQAIEIHDQLELDINIAFCYYEREEDLLFVGEFYREKNYKTDKSHHLTKDGETNYAFVYVFVGDESGLGGIQIGQPYAVLSVRGLVQGIAVSQDKIYLSCSYGLPDSKLYTYSNPLHGGEEYTDLHGVPVYRLDKDNLISTLTMPCMSEEICFKDGKLYILFESLCNKYKNFVRVRMDKVVAIPLEKIGV